MSTEDAKNRLLGDFDFGNLFLLQPEKNRNKIRFCQGELNRVWRSNDLGGSVQTFSEFLCKYASISK